MVAQFLGEIDKEGRIQIPDDVVAKAGIKPGSIIFVVLEPFDPPVVRGYIVPDKFGVKPREHKENWNYKDWNRETGRFRITRFPQE